MSCFPIRGNRLFCALMPSFAGMRRQATAAFFPYEIFGAGAESPCFTRVRVLGSRTKSTCRGRIPVPGFSFLFLPVVPVERPSLLPCPCRGFGKGREGKAQERRSGRRGENPLLRGSRGRRASFPSPAGGRGKAGRRRRTGRKGGRGEAFRKGGLPGFFAFPYAPVVSTSLPFRLAARREGSVLSVFSLRHQVVRNG